EDALSAVACSGPASATGTAATIQRASQASATIALSLVRRFPASAPAGLGTQFEKMTTPMDVLLANLLKLRLAAGIVSVADPSIPIGLPRAIAYADAVLRAAAAHEVDTWELIGVARNESAFRVHDVGPDGKDCGITQTRVTASRYSCRQLRRSFTLGFLE